MHTHLYSRKLCLKSVPTFFPSSPKPEPISPSKSILQTGQKPPDTLNSSCTLSLDLPPKSSVRFPLCRHCRIKGTNHTTLKREFITALYAYNTAKRLLKLADTRTAGRFNRRLNPIYTGGEWEGLSGELGWINWHWYFRQAVTAAEYSMTRTISCLGCQFACRMKQAGLAVVLGEAVKGRRDTKGRFGEGVEVLLDDAVGFSRRMMEAGEIV